MWHIVCPQNYKPHFGSLQILEINDITCSHRKENICYLQGNINVGANEITKLLRIQDLMLCWCRPHKRRPFPSWTNVWREMWGNYYWQSSNYRSTKPEKENIMWAIAWQVKVWSLGGAGWAGRWEAGGRESGFGSNVRFLLQVQEQRSEKEGLF